MLMRTATPVTGVDEVRPQRRRSDRMKGTKKFTVGALFAGAMLAGSIAFAAWTASGTGSGYAKATNAQALTTVDVSATTAATLYPGATGEREDRDRQPESLRGDRHRRRGFRADRSRMKPRGACDGSMGVTFTDQTGLTLDVPAGSTATFVLAGSVEMDNTSDTTCQGAVFTIPVTLSGLSDALSPVTPVDREGGENPALSAHPDGGERSSCASPLGASRRDCSSPVCSWWRRSRKLRSSVWDRRRPMSEGPRHRPASGSVAL